MNLFKGASSKDWISFSASLTLKKSIFELLKNRENFKYLPRKINLTATAIKKENGEIEIQYKNYENLDKSNMHFTKQSYLLMFFLHYLTLIFLLIKALVIIPNIQKNNIAKIYYFAPLFFFILLTIITIKELRLNEGEQFLKNHGAEHMVYTAYKILKRVPSIVEAKKFSRFNKECGSAYPSAFITAQILGFIVFCTTGFVIPEFLLIIVPVFMSDIFPFYIIGYFIQLFTTKKPDDDNLRLAISALFGIEALTEITQLGLEDFFKESN